MSYDCPQFVKTYIHRVGRTARAGRPGTGVTLVEKSEAKRFKQLLREAGKTGVADETVDEDQLDLQAYEAAKKQAAAVIKAEGESESAKLISQATSAAGPGFIELRRIEAAKEIASTLARSRNVAYLPGGNGANVLLGLGNAGGGN